MTEKHGDQRVVLRKRFFPVFLDSGEMRTARGIADTRGLRMRTLGVSEELFLVMLDLELFDTLLGGEELLQ